jgi:hypothetical protein
MHFDTGGHLIIAYKGVHKLDDVEKWLSFLIITCRLIWTSSYMLLLSLREFSFICWECILFWQHWSYSFNIIKNILFLLYFFSRLGSCLLYLPHCIIELLHSWPPSQLDCHLSAPDGVADGAPSPWGQHGMRLLVFFWLSFLQSWRMW